MFSFGFEKIINLDMINLKYFPSASITGMGLSVVALERFCSEDDSMDKLSCFCYSRDCSVLYSQNTQRQVLRGGQQTSPAHLFAGASRICDHGVT